MAINKTLIYSLETIGFDEAEFLSLFELCLFIYLEQELVI